MMKAEFKSKFLHLISIMDEVGKKRGYCKLEYRPINSDGKTKGPQYEIYMSNLPQNAPNFVKSTHLDDAITHAYRLKNDDSLFKPSNEELRDKIMWKKEEVSDLQDEIKNMEGMIDD